MLKRFSRRVMRSFAVACLMLAVVCLGGAQLASGAFYSGTQYLVITGASSINLSQVCRFDYNTGTFPCYNAFFGSYTLSYPYPYFARYAFWLYDHNQARWVELTYVQDIPQ